MLFGHVLGTAPTLRAAPNQCHPIAKRRGFQGPESLTKQRRTHNASAWKWQLPVEWDKKRAQNTTENDRWVFGFVAVVVTKTSKCFPIMERPLSPLTSRTFAKRPGWSSALPPSSVTKTNHRSVSRVSLQSGCCHSTLERYALRLCCNDCGLDPRRFSVDAFLLGSGSQRGAVPKYWQHTSQQHLLLSRFRDTDRFRLCS